MVFSYINVDYSEFDIASLDEQIELTGGQFPNNTVSPFYQDEFLYIGITFFND